MMGGLKCTGYRQKGLADKVLPFLDVKKLGVGSSLLLGQYTSYQCCGDTRPCSQLDLYTIIPLSQVVPVVDYSS